MALPMVLSMMVSSLYNIVDSFFIARISEDAMTALSLVYPVQNLINAVMIGFGIGINAVISFYLGGTFSTRYLFDFQIVITPKSLKQTQLFNIKIGKACILEK